jgi:predicted nucleic acid-binding protein
MLKKIIVTTALSIQFAAVPLGLAQTSAPATPDNAHKTKHDKVRACRAEARARQLHDEELRAFVAQCAKADGAGWRHPNDLPVLALLIGSGTDHLVTGDRELLVLAGIYPIRTPAEFVDRFVR